MFAKILVPVDLYHLNDLSGALATATQMAKSYNAEIIFVGVYGNLPADAVPPPHEYPAELKAFSDKLASANGITTTSVPVFSHDPQAELASALLSVAADSRAEVIVMPSHIPDWVDHIYRSNAGYVANHAPISVFVVR